VRRQTVNLIYFRFSNVAASNGELNEFCSGHEGERFWPNLRYYCIMFLDGLRKIMTNLSGYLFSGRRFEFETWLYTCIEVRLHACVYL